MFYVKHTLKPSKINGIGLFANQNIKKGEVVYEVVLADDLLLTNNEFITLTSSQKSTIEHFGYFDKKLSKWHLANDDIKFCNHSPNSNVSLIGSKLIALRNINSGDEILHNYQEIEDLRVF